MLPTIEKTLFCPPTIQTFSSYSLFTLTDLGGHIEAQPFGTDVGPSLLRAGAHVLPQCPVQQVGGRVFLHAAQTPGLKSFCYSGPWVKAEGGEREGETWGSADPTLSTCSCT